MDVCMVLSAFVFTQKTKTEYRESRYQKGSANLVKRDGKSVENEAVKIEDIPESAELKWDYNSDHWLRDIPKAHDLELTHPETVIVTTNSIRIDDKSLTVHQYTFDIYKNEPDEQKENSIDLTSNPFINDNNNNTNDNSINESKPTIPSTPKVNLSADERRDVFNRFSFFFVCILWKFSQHIFCMNNTQNPSSITSIISCQF